MPTDIRYPTGIGAQDGLVSINGVNKWLEVDDVDGSPDDDATYLYFDGAGGAGQTQLFTFSTAFAVDAARYIRYVAVHSRLKAVGGTHTSTARLRVGGTTYLNGTSSSNSVAAGWVDRVALWPLNPKSGALWTPAEVNGTDPTNPLQQYGVGVASMVAGEVARLTYCYVAVHWSYRKNYRRKLLMGVG